MLVYWRSASGARGCDCEGTGDYFSGEVDRKTVCIDRPDYAGESEREHVIM